MDRFFARNWRARPVAKLASLFRSVLVGGAVVGLVQPAFALGIDFSEQQQSIFPTSGQGVYAALLELDRANPPPAQGTNDTEAFSALTSFAASMAERSPQAVASKPTQLRADDAVFSELADFAKSVAVTPPQSRQPRVKLADADNMVDALKDFMQGNSTTPPANAPVAPPAAVKVARPAVDAHIVGDKVCMTCHAPYAESFSKTLMGRIWRTQPGKFACENCHGAGSEHVRLGGGRGVGGIISFRSNDTSRGVAEYNAICLTCHERGDRTYWSGSTHEVRGVACTDCHTIMRAVSAKFNLKTVYEPETCFQCHKDRRAQMMRSSHMPLREGKMTCTDCHQPHGTANEALLRTATINETCYKCHAEKRGPFLFEHTPVRENCLNCHDPHGSINEYMLRIARPRLCTECHGFGHSPAAGLNSYQIIGRACNNCHTQVHGTNDPSGALLHR
jgi:DmsE family decaheme c-type cytochrome